MQIFNGKDQALLLDNVIANKISSLNVKPHLCIVQIDNDAVSNTYIKIKSQVGKKLGIPVTHIVINSNIDDEQIYTQFKQICNTPKFTGIILQLPLPRKTLFDLVNLIPLYKDVDVLSVVAKEKNLLLSPVVLAFLNFTNFYKIDLANITTGLIGDGFLVGMPIYNYLKTQKLNVNLINNYKTGSALNYDLLILSSGIGNLVHCTNLKSNCYVIDFTTVKTEQGICGDLILNTDCTNIKAASLSTGGMGPLVVRYLFLNLCDLLNKAK